MIAETDSRRFGLRGVYKDVTARGMGWTRYQPFPVPNGRGMLGGIKTGTCSKVFGTRYQTLAPSSNATVVPTEVIELSNELRAGATSVFA